MSRGRARKTKKDIEKEQYEIFKEIAKKDGLKVGFTKNSMYGDNAFFVPKDFYEEAKKDLQTPGYVTRWLEDKLPTAKSARKMQLRALLAAQKKATSKGIEDGVVLIGSGRAFGDAPEIVAHELGHASNHKENKWLKHMRRPLYLGLGGLTTAALAAADHVPASLIAAGLTYGPTLYDEGKASIRGYQNLKELGKKPNKEPLIKGFASYALAPALAIGWGKLMDYRTDGATHKLLPKSVDKFLDSYGL